MAWRTLTLTTADNTVRVAFAGRGSVYAEGTFGGGSIGAHPVVDGIASTGFLDSALDGSTVKTLDLPAGQYELDLAGSTGASVTVYYNDQAQIVID